MKFLVLLVSIAAVNAFFGSMVSRSRVHSTSLSSTPEFDGKEFEEALKQAGPGVYGADGILGGDDLQGSSDDIVSKLRDEQMARRIKAQEEGGEKLFREYQYADMELPVLPDCNNYYSGKMGDNFWHQNSDNVYLYFPISDDIKKKDIDVKFEARKVTVNIEGMDDMPMSFDCMERLIPDGSFWMLEEGKDNKKYLHLDLEKRFRMINWKNLLGEPQEEEQHADEIDKRSKMLEKLFAANKGMSKMTGVEVSIMPYLYIYSIMVI